MTVILVHPMGIVAHMADMAPLVEVRVDIAGSVAILHCLQHPVP